MAENVESTSLPMCENGSRKLIAKQLPGSDSDERMAKECIKDGNRGCYPGEIHCSPGTGGGCCPAHRPVCCGNGYHCRKYGPC